MLGARGPFKSFSEAGVSFESILYNGMLGGSSAVKSYLMLRRKMFLRYMSQASSSGIEPEQFIRAITVLDQAMELMDLLGHPAPAPVPEVGPAATEAETDAC